MAICQTCLQDKPQSFKCGRCRAVQYCSKDCQRVAWSEHKLICTAHAAGQQLQRTQSAILLGEGFSARSIQIPTAPVRTPLIRQHFSQHKQSTDRDFIDVLMPISDRLFGRPMRIVYDQSSPNRLQPNTFATRDTCNLLDGLGPNIRGQVSKQHCITSSATMLFLCCHLQPKHRNCISPAAYSLHRHSCPPQP